MATHFSLCSEAVFTQNQPSRCQVMDNARLLCVFTDTRGYEGRRPQRETDDLCLEISQTLSCTSLELTHSVRHIQMFKAPFSLSPVLCVFECCGLNEAT